MSASSSDAPVAIVTGAGRGLGREHALALARAGYDLVVNDLGGAGDGTGADATPAQQVVAQIEALGQRAIANGADVSNWEAAGEMIRSAVEHFGRLDALVNNAGILRDRTIANITEEDWDLSIAVNLKGSAAPLHHAAAYWRDLSKARGEPVNAAVVNTTSASGLYGAAGQSNYAAAKLGVAAMSVAAARELGRYGVRVNVLAPAAVTRLTEGVMKTEELKQRLQPRFVAPLVVYLLSDAARDITGRVFEMGGGALVAVDMPRPGAGLRHADGEWTPERIAEIMPTLLEQVPAQPSGIEAMQYMMSAPLDE
ncbi:SDR family NAD(P)-dependent oxidoreductase [Mangrovimicrobium sediminis]|uniref:SDR family NAD(P)-dependent oxidoreductase n=1 Tax=Mangrovimicrobium sediminis TaxID=2562682 RepID=A0A4Z0LVJ9_9GAMM|nr:SDR family NAD(P)-dependent oxidoreductase [Haliea sp. SAOS-164]TGD71264.1 SDR family NAD(P)-dependent oxidoreductase [Haliea sp. SAOS-164]